jgi:hypothetical protein
MGRLGLLAGLLVLWVGGAGQTAELPNAKLTKHEEVMARMAEATKGIQAALEGIKDEATAQAAFPKLKELYTVFFRAQKDMQGLGQPPKGVEQELVRHQTSVAAGMEQIQAQIERLQSAPYFRFVGQAVQAGQAAAQEPEKAAKEP